MAKWDLSVFYKSLEDWDKDYERFLSIKDLIKGYNGKLHEEKSFLACLDLSHEIDEILSRLYVYVSSHADLDLANDTYANKRNSLMVALTEYSSDASFINPEIIKIGSKTILGFIKNNPKYASYEFSYNELFRLSERILSDKEERIISTFGRLDNTFKNFYQSLAILDPVNQEVSLSDGTKVVVNHSNYPVLIQNSKTPEDRAAIFSAVYKRYRDNKNSYANLYEQILTFEYTNARIRGYNSAIEAKLDGENIPLKVFTSLIDASYSASPSIRRYIALRKKLLKLDTYHTYDRFLTLTEDKSKYTYEEGKEIVLKAMKDTNPELYHNVEVALEDGFVDSEPFDTKRTGAYSNSIYGFHPLILLNHDKSLDSIFTIAHEAGHSSHSIFSNENQSYETANYTIFVAEIASTFNEHILLDYLLKNSTDKNQKINLIEKAIDSIMSTFFRQTLFANYEYEANKIIEKNEPFNVSTLSAIMIDLYKHYYDIDITKEDGKELVWCYIPHLYYSPYYVYQYASSFAASLAIYKNIQKNKDKGYEGLLKMLKAGGSTHSIDIVKLAGVDLTEKDSYLAVIDRFNYLLDELEKVVNE
ncbi:MAG: oligoendopeptidase F [Acholeplasmatales bacterium]|jgi:oligoendopeptidase F|nr:oligoendopeptidase F [Acholeplasmatales bacterium]